MKKIILIISAFNVFEKNIEDLNSLIKDNEAFFKKIENMFTEKNELFMKLEDLKNIIILYKNRNINQLIEYSLEKYYTFFNKNIVDLITKIPEYALDEKGEPFWKGSKIMPHPINFDNNDELSKQFIIYFIKIINRILRINLNINENEIENKSSAIYNKIISEKKIVFPESEQKQEEIIEKLKIDIIKLIQECELIEQSFNSEKFDKDNDDYFHVDFIYTFSNLRARNYNIEECNKEKVRKLAGNIIPAIVSTTACIAGFVAIQIYSILQSNEIKTMRNIGLDLGTSWFSIGTPEEVRTYTSIEKVNKASNIIEIPNKFSIWDSITINGPLTAKQIISLFQEEYNLSIEYINSNNECILDLIEEENEEEINKKIEELYLERFKDDLKNKKYLKLMALGEQNGININLPRIKYILNELNK